MDRAYLVAGLGYGDEGKGATVDALTRHLNARLVVRYNGGPQAAHNVVTPEGVHHTFSQLGSGSLAGAETLLSRYMLVNPGNMLQEANVLALNIGIRSATVLDMVKVSEQAVVITPFQVEHNRRLAIGNKTCGQGIGATREYQIKFPKCALTVADLNRDDNMEFAKAKLFTMRDYYGYDLDITKMVQIYRAWIAHVQVCDELDVLTKTKGAVIFEGAQGVLLDETHGEEGYNTWTDTTFTNAERLLSYAGFTGLRHRIGVIRTYHTRHGEGPFPTEDNDLFYPEPHNSDEGYQGKFRRGAFDLKLMEKALTICGGVNSIALNHLDQHDPKCPVIDYSKISIGGHGPTAADRTIVADTLNE